MRRCIVWFATLLASASCGSSGAAPEPGGVLSDSAGVAVWSVPQTDYAASFGVERLAGFAAPDTGWAVWPDGLAVDRVREVVYVLDESTPRLLVFDYDGRFIEQLGQKGDGPGEYDSPTALAVGRSGDLRVVDPGAGAVHRWSNGREYVDRESLSPDYWGPGFAIRGESLVYTTAGGEETGTMIEALVTVGVEGVDTLMTVPSTWAPLEMPCGRVPVPEVFSRSVVWGGAPGAIAYVEVPRYTVVLQRGAARRTIFEMGVGPRRVTADEAEASVLSGPLQFLVEGCGMTPAGVVRGAGFVSEVSPVFLLTVDPLDRVWAARGIPPRVESIDLLDPDEGFLGTLESSAFPVVFLDEDRYLTIVDTVWGPVVEVWRVVP